MIKGYPGLCFRGFDYIPEVSCANDVDKKLLSGLWDDFMERFRTCPAEIQHDVLIDALKKMRDYHNGL